MEWLERLRAALDEDDRIARRAAADWPDWTYNRETFTVASARYVVAGRKDVNSPLNDVDGEHIARQDPKRILDMVAAHREVLDGYTRALEYRAEVDAADPRSFEDADVRDTTIAAAYATVDALESVLWALAKGYGIES